MSEGGWIKVRRELLSSPQLLKMSRILSGERDFRDWITPGGGGPMSGQIVSHAASHFVTLGGLICVWSAARIHGTYVGDDLLLPGLVLHDLDEMSQIPGFGWAMNEVEWAFEDEDSGGVILPKFKQHNIAMTSNDRKKRQRERDNVSRNGHENVTQMSRRDRDKNVTKIDTVQNSTEQYKEPGTGAFSKLASEDWQASDLQDDKRLLSFIAELCRGDPEGYPSCRETGLHIFGAAVRALDVGKKPIALFVDIVKTRRWHVISAAQEDEANLRLKVAESCGPVDQQIQIITKTLANGKKAPTDDKTD